MEQKAQWRQETPEEAVASPGQRGWWFEQMGGMQGRALGWELCFGEGAW